MSSQQDGLMSSHRRQDGEDVAELHRSVRRLRRENRLLRQQVLRMQDERRRVLHTQDTTVDSLQIRGESAASSSIQEGEGGGAEDTQALRVRLQTLQRQNERERVRRQQVERDLRAEVERLRRSLEDEHGAGGPLPSAASPVGSSSPAPLAAVPTASGAVLAGDRTDVKRTPPPSPSCPNNGGAEPPTFARGGSTGAPLALRDASSAPLALDTTYSDDAGEDGGLRRQPGSSGSSVTSSWCSGAAGLLQVHGGDTAETAAVADASNRGALDDASYAQPMSATTGDAVGPTSVVVPSLLQEAATLPLSCATPEDIQRLYQASVDRYSAVSRGGRDAGGTFTGFDFPGALTSTTPESAVAGTADGPLDPQLRSGLGRDDQTALQQQQQQQRNEADELMRKAADRRAQRKLRLEKFAVSTASSSSSVAGNPRVAVGEGDGAGTASHRDVRASPAAVAASKDSSPGAGAPSNFNLANPNQIGTEIKEEERNRTWYLKQVIVQALLQAIHPSSSSSSAAAMPVAAPNNNKKKSNDGGAATEAAGTDARHGGPEAWMRSLMDDDDDDDDDVVDDSRKRQESAHAGGTDATTPFPPIARESRATSLNPSFLPISDSTVFAVSPTTTTAPTTAPPNQFVYKDINMIAMQRAIADCISMHFRCRRNEPYMTTANYKEGQGHPVGAGAAGGSGGDGPWGAFADENTDPRLLQAFSPQQQHAKGSTAHDHSTATSIDGIDWDDADNDDEADGTAFNMNNANNLRYNAHRSASPAAPARGGAGGSSSSGRRKEKSAKGGRAHDTRDRFREDEVVVHFHAPVVFSQLRSFLHLDDNYLRASVGKAVWRQSASPGKSKTTLYYFADFVMKSMKEGEVDFFHGHFLPYYLRYCERNPHTLLPRFYAVITVKWLKLNVKRTFLLMQNVFTTRYYIHRIYDVKGSTVGRTAYKLVTTKTAGGGEQSVLTAPRTAFGALLLKDNDLPPQLIICGDYQRAILLAQFRSDVNFLSSLNIVDYSCMIGVRSRVFSAEQGPSKTVVLRRRKPPAHYHTKSKNSSAKRRGNRYGANASASAQQHDSSTDDDNDGVGDAIVAKSVAEIASSGVIGVGAPPLTAGGRNYGYTFGSTDGNADGRGGGGGGADERDDGDDLFICLHGCDGGLLSLPIYAPGDDTTAREDVYYLGIIDVLQEYNSIKKLENFAKGLVNDRKQISVIPPKEYAERLYQVLERIAT